MLYTSTSAKHVVTLRCCITVAHEVLLKESNFFQVFYNGEQMLHTRVRSRQVRVLRCCMVEDRCCTHGLDWDKYMFSGVEWLEGRLSQEDQYETRSCSQVLYNKAQLFQMRNSLRQVITLRGCMIDDRCCTWGLAHDKYLSCVAW